MRAKLAVPALALGCLLMASDTIAPLGKYTATERRHWAFVPRSHPDIPVFPVKPRIAPGSKRPSMPSSWPA